MIIIILNSIEINVFVKVIKKFCEDRN